MNKKDAFYTENAIQEMKVYKKDAFYTVKCNTTDETNKIELL